MPAHFTESSYEESIIELFEGMDYSMSMVQSLSEII